MFQASDHRNLLLHRSFSVIRHPCAGTLIFSRHAPSLTSCDRMRIGLAAGARLVAATPFAKSRFKGSEMLLTAASRTELCEYYHNAFASGAGAVLTSLDTSQIHLDETGLYSDMSLDNDLSYYVVGKGNGEGGYELQEPRQKRLGGLASGWHCIPRQVHLATLIHASTHALSGPTHHPYAYAPLPTPHQMVSIGEMRNFAGVLAELAVKCAAKGRDLAGSHGLVGATIRFETGFVGDFKKPQDAHLGSKMGYQMQMAQAADFFVVTGCSTAADVAAIARELEDNRKSVERRYRSNLRGMMELEDEPSVAGFDVPALVLTTARPCTDDFYEVLSAANEAARIIGVGAPSTLSDAELERCNAVLSDDSFLIAGPSEAAGELAVQPR